MTTMIPETRARAASKKMQIAGHVLGVLPALLLLFSAAMKLLGPPDVIDGFSKLGYDPKILMALGIVELACTILYLIPQTAVLGAILLTGYLGGAVATHVRVNEAFLPAALVGVVVWLGIYLRDARLRALVPIRRMPAAPSKPDQ